MSFLTIRAYLTSSARDKLLPDPLLITTVIVIYLLVHMFKLMRPMITPWFHALPAPLLFGQPAMHRVVFIFTVYPAGALSVEIVGLNCRCPMKLLTASISLPAVPMPLKALLPSTIVLAFHMMTLKTTPMTLMLTTMMMLMMMAHTTHHHMTTTTMMMIMMMIVLTAMHTFSLYPPLPLLTLTISTKLIPI